MAVSTASMWRRRESDSVHLHSRFHASGREIATGMASTLAGRGVPGSTVGGPDMPAGATPATLRRARRAASRAGVNAMSEKFVIEGGVPLSGTIVPAGNKNGALPILAACLLTTDEVILRNVPRINDVDAMSNLIEGL